MNKLHGLTLTLKAGERIRLRDPRRPNDLVWVGLARVGGSKATLVISAPGEVDIVREELLARSGHDGPKEGSPGQDASMAKDGL